ncbi:hypothetical protein [Aeromonas sp. MdU4]
MLQLSQCWDFYYLGRQELAEQAGNEAAQAAELKALTERLEQEIGRFRL